MPTAQFSETNLQQLCQQLNAWRGSHPAHTRLPEAVWEAASRLARQHGVSRVAHTLRVNFYKLRRRTLQVPGRPARKVSAAPAAGFVEIPWPSSASAADRGPCTVELSDGRRGQMTVRLPSDGAALVALAEAFWRRRR